METIRVSVVAFGDRKHWQMQYRDPVTGKKKTRSTGVENTGRKRERDAAIGVAGKWEAELREGRYQSPSKTTWASFRDRYETEALAGLSDNTAMRVHQVFDLIELLTPVERLAEMTTRRVAEFQHALRTVRKVRETTVKSYLAHLKASLNWAHRAGLLVTVPKFEMPKRAAAVKMKGRPITGEEFERMVMATESVVGIDAKESWEFYLKGLWTSGLRLAESLELYWDRTDKLCVDLDGKHPMLRIPAGLEKGHRNRLLPMAPEFATLLATVPEAERTGPVFKLPSRHRGHGGRIGWQHAGLTVGDIGRKAGVKVEEREGKPAKCATAHDLRRSFGFRWATRVMPAVLQQLMRHSAIETTMTYYVGKNAEATAAVLWEAHEAAKGNTFGNSGTSKASAAAPTNDAQTVSSQQPSAV